MARRARELPRVLVADPAWRFDDSLPGKTRGAARNYRTMTVDEIRAFPVPRMADDSFLFLWRVSSMVEEAYSVARAWGFRPVAEIVWMKLTSTGEEVFFGMGRTVRASHETCIIAKRGSPSPKSRSERSVLLAPRGRHSEKPVEFYALVERLFDGPYVELFARRRRAGWAQHGDELPPEARVA